MVFGHFLDFKLTSEISRSYTKALDLTVWRGYYHHTCAEVVFGGEGGIGLSFYLLFDLTLTCAHSDHFQWHNSIF